MKASVLVALLMLTMSAFGEETLPPFDSIDPIGGTPGPGCEASCAATLLKCKQQCEAEVTSGDMERSGEPAVSDSACVSACEADAAYCRDDC